MHSTGSGRSLSLFRRRLFLAALLLFAAATAAGLMFPSLLSRQDRITEAQPTGQVGGPSAIAAGRSLLRVAAPPPEKVATVISPYGPGFEYELVERFCAENGYEARWLPVASREEGFAALANGQADIVAGFGALTNDGRAKELGLRGGKVYVRFQPIRVHGAAIAPTTESGEDAEPLADPVTGPITDLGGAASAEAAVNGSELFSWPAGEGPLLISPAMDLGGGSHDVLMLDPASYALWLPLLGSVRAEQLRGRTFGLRWFWREPGPEESAQKVLAERLEAFWKAPAMEPFLEDLTERYYGFLPDRLQPGEILDLKDALINRVPAYQDMILAAARETGVPPLLLVAVIYRESRFDPDAVSATNVRGIMQLTTGTAEMLGVDRRNPAQCILGGARYLRSIWDSLEDRRLPEWDRWYMTLAGYNQGPGGLSGATRISRNLGDSGDSWLELKKAYPQLVNSRGREAVAFVENIRYYYYLLNGLLVLSPSEMEHLTPLLGAAPFVS